MAQTSIPTSSQLARAPLLSRVQVSLGRRVQTNTPQQQRRLILALGYSFLAEIMSLTHNSQSQVEEEDDLHRLLHWAQAFLAETCDHRPGITLPQIRSYLNRWVQNQQRRVTLRLQVRRGRVYLWRVLQPTVLVETEMVWQVGYTLLDRLIRCLAQWEQNADGRRGWWQGRLQIVVGLAERFLDVTAELEPVFLDEQGERLSFHPYLEHKQWLVAEVLPLSLLPVAELFYRLEALRRPVYLTRPQRVDAQHPYSPGPIRVSPLRRKSSLPIRGMTQRGRKPVTGAD